MGYDIRPLATLAAQARQFFTQSIPGTLSSFWANTFTVFGKVLALLDFEHEMRRQWLFKQLFASTADELWLDRHGFELGLTPDPGSAVLGAVIVPAISGTLVPAGVAWTRLDGATYTTLSSAIAAGNTVTLVVQSDLAGASYAMNAGDMLQVVFDGNVPVGLGTTATVAPGGLIGGTEPEDVETFRARVLYRKRNPPQGGSAADYVEWVGAALSTVKAVFVDSFLNDSRSVWVCFTVTDRDYGVPDDGQIATAQAYVSDPVRRPVTARVFVVPPTLVPVPIVIHNLAPDTTDVRGAIAAEIAALQVDEMQPATPSTAFVLYREAIDAAIARATGVRHFTLVSPANDIAFTTASEMPALQPPSYA